MSVKPSVASSAVGAARPSSRALVVTVVPCANAVIAPGAAPVASIAANTPRASSPGVVGAFAITSSPSGEASTASVNVPPTSTPSSIAPDPIVGRQTAAAARSRGSEAAKSRCARSVIGPGASRRRPSTLAIGTTSAPVPVRNASSAVHASAITTIALHVDLDAVLAQQPDHVLARDPGEAAVGDGRRAARGRRETRKTLSAVHSAISPAAFSSSASWAPRARASAAASTEVR